MSHLSGNMPRALLLSAVFLIPTSLLADQNDPRLDALFTRLQISSDSQQLRFVEASIWEIWMQHDNEDVQQLLIMGTNRMNAGQYPEALLIFTQLAQAEPDFAEVWNKRATLYYMMGDMDASLADIERTLALEPRHFGAISGRGLIEISREQFSTARDTFTELLAIHPNSPSAQRNLELVLEELRNSVI